MLNYDAQDLQYLQMMQENITRMAENSANAKTWLQRISLLRISCLHLKSAIRVNGRILYVIVRKRKMIFIEEAVKDFVQSHIILLSSI